MFLNPILYIKVMKILLDYRERKSGIKKELIKQGLEVIEKQLVSADFVIKTKDIHGKILTIGIERKTLSFASNPTLTMTSFELVAPTIISCFRIFRPSFLKI